MKETKQFLRNQNDIYDTMMIDHIKAGQFNYIYVRDLCNQVIANTVTLKGIESAHPSKVNKTKKK